MTNGRRSRAGVSRRPHVGLDRTVPLGDEHGFSGRQDRIPGDGCAPSRSIFTTSSPPPRRPRSSPAACSPRRRWPRATPTDWARPHGHLRQAVTVDTSGGTPRIQFRLGPICAMTSGPITAGRAETALVFTYTVRHGRRRHLASGGHSSSGAARSARPPTITVAPPSPIKPGQSGHKVDGSLTTNPGFVTERRARCTTSKTQDPDETYGGGDDASTRSLQGGVCLSLWTFRGLHRARVLSHRSSGRGNGGAGPSATTKTSWPTGWPSALTPCTAATRITSTRSFGGHGPGVHLYGAGRRHGRRRHPASRANAIELFRGTIRDATDTIVDATLTYAQPGIQSGHKVDGSLTTTTNEDDGTDDDDGTTTTPPVIVTGGVQVTSTPMATGDTYGGRDHRNHGHLRQGGHGGHVRRHAQARRSRSASTGI